MLLYGTALSGIQMGLCYSVLALGLYISYTILDFPDLSVDGTFPLGGGGLHNTYAQTRIPSGGGCRSFVGRRNNCRGGDGISSRQVPDIKAALRDNRYDRPALRQPCADKAADKKRLHDNDILVQKRKPHRAFRRQACKPFRKSRKGLHDDRNSARLCNCREARHRPFHENKAGLYAPLDRRERKACRLHGKDPGRYKILGIAAANGLVAMSGGVYSGMFSSYDNNSGSGKVVLALASVIIGLALFSQVRRVKDTTAVIVGALIYGLLLNFLALADREGIYLKLLNAVMFALILIFNDRPDGNRSAQKNKGSRRNAGEPYRMGKGGVSRAGA